VTKCSSEISLAGKVERECNIDQGLISSYQQRFGTLETLCADVLVRRLANGSLECSREMEPAQARNRCQVIDRKFALVVDEGKLTRRRCASFDETREGSVMHHKLAHGAWVFVVDGQKALFLINGGDERFPNLRRLAVEEHKDPPSREQGSDAPGRAYSSVGEVRSAVGETDWHELEKERFAASIADRINKVALSGAFNQLVIVAPPKILGDLRRKFTKETETKIIAEVPKDLTHQGSGSVFLRNRITEIDQLIPAQLHQDDEHQPRFPGGAAIGVPISV
jgi:protein required for attachment to host cells